MMDLISMFPPGVILILGALLVPLFKGNLRNWFVISLPLITFFYILQLDPSTQLVVPFLDLELSIIRADKWAKIFGYVFTLSAFATSIYGFYQKKSTEYVSALLYIGSALMVVFAGDLVTLYIFWEAMALTSVILILARRTQSSRRAGFRYVIVHIFGGLVLLAGIILHIHQTGSIAFGHFTTETLATWLILIGFLVNAAAYPLSSWLPDAYPEASVIGGVILSAYTSKTAVYALIRGFAGWDILIVLGLVMAVYGVIYGLLENDIRRILSYSIVNQVGFMVCAVGIGSPLALVGAAAHAFCHIIYKALLWMSAGAVLHRTGKSKCTDLGGIYKTMPLTFIFGIIGALSISAPFTSGFTIKSIIFIAAEQAHLFWPWLILEVASAGVFLQAGVRMPYFVFFGKDSGLRPKEANKFMLVAMGFLSFVCIYLGLFPNVLYDVLPHSGLVKDTMPFLFTDIYGHHFSHVVTKMQILSFTVLSFFLFLPLLKRSDTISLDVDWVYRKGWPVFFKSVRVCLTSVNNAVYYIFVTQITEGLVRFAKNAPANIMVSIMNPIWAVQGYSIEQRKERRALVYRNVSSNTFPIGLAAILIIIVLGTLTL